MKIPFYQIDAFTGSVFCGNPAGVCLLDTWPDKVILQSIAAENNLSETAFLVKQGQYYDLRWFTPLAEVDLCGHATLASGHVIFEFINPDSTRVNFKSKSGMLSVQKKNDLLFLDFPSRPPAACKQPRDIGTILGAAPSDVLIARDMMAVFDNEDTIRTLAPDVDAIAEMDCFALIVTAPGKTSDFVSRFFAPKVGVPEDPVTGSAHCTLIPYWANRLKKNNLHAYQLSKRGGELFCTDKGNRVSIGGRAVTYLTGTILI